MIPSGQNDAEVDGLRESVEGRVSVNAGNDDQASDNVVCAAQELCQNDQTSVHVLNDHQSLVNSDEQAPSNVKDTPSALVPHHTAR